MTWLGFAGVFALFFVTHSIPVRPAIKSKAVSRIGARGFTLVYSLLSLSMLTLLIWSAGQAPYVELWPQLPWQRHVVHFGMLLVCLCLSLCIGRPNPFSFGGANNDAFDSSHPGIVRLTRHPVLMALALWAGLHLLVNGDLAHVLLFGILGAFALAGRFLINRRMRMELGGPQWQIFNTAVAQTPLVQVPASWRDTGIRILIGLTAYTALLLLHPVVIGVAAF